MLKERKRLLERMTELEMRLDTVVIKINETEENKKNYDLTLAHLRVRDGMGWGRGSECLQYSSCCSQEEEFDRWVKLETLRAQVAESEGTADACSVRPVVSLNSDGAALCAKMEREKQHKLQQKDRGEVGVLYVGLSCG